MSIDLLAPRYEVIANYPESQFKIGDVWPDVAPDWTTDEQRQFTTESMAKYPALFRKLQWWEHRKPEEMPEYVFDANGDCFKVQKYEIRHSLMWMVLDKENAWAVVPNVMNFYEPATLTDYTTLNSHTK